jgi:hypothetical protein
MNGQYTMLFLFTYLVSSIRIKSRSKLLQHDVFRYFGLVAVILVYLNYINEDGLY